MGFKIPLPLLFALILFGGAAAMFLGDRLGGFLGTLLYRAGTLAAVVGGILCISYIL